MFFYNIFSVLISVEYLQSQLSWTPWKYLKKVGVILHISIHCYSGSEGDGTDDVDVLEEEGDGELQIITECWIEPQHGLVVNCPPERDYMEHLPYHKLADVVSTLNLFRIIVIVIINFQHNNGSRAL
jgi:hypothetical protein